MMNADKAVALEKLAANKDFLNAVASTNCKDELQKVFHDFDLEMSRDEIDAFILMMEASVSEELSDDVLDQVSGGVSAKDVFGWAWNGAKAVAKTAWSLGKKFADWEKSLF